MVQINNTKNTDNIKKHDFTVPECKNLNDQNIQLQDVENYVPYDAEAFKICLNIIVLFLKIRIVFTIFHCKNLFNSIENNF